jgi:hypothetical protein
MIKESITSTVAPRPGSLLLALDRTPLTDATPVLTIKIACLSVDDLLVDLVADKGCDLVITPLPVADDEALAGEPSETLSIPAGGGARRGRYPEIGAPQAMIVVTKTEAGDMTAFTLAVRGAA